MPEDNPLIPRERLNTKIEENKTLSDELTAVKAELEALKASGPKSEALKQEFAAAKAEWASQKFMYQQGLTNPDIHDLLILKFNRGEEKDFGKFFESEKSSSELLKMVLAPTTATASPTTAAPVVEDTAASPAEPAPEAPTPVVPATPATTAPVVPAAPVVPVQPGNESVVAAPQPLSHLDPHAISKMNKDEYSQYRDSILKSL